MKKLLPLKRLVWLLIVVAVIGLVALPEASFAVEAEGGEGHSEKTYMDLYEEGGPVMHFLLVFSVLVMSFTIEGFVKLRKSRLAPAPLVARLREAMASGSYQEAWQICQANKCFLSSVLSEGLERLGRGKDAVDYAVQEAALREGTNLKTNGTFLSVIGVTAPMVGLTGTVLGMMGAFTELGQSGIANPSALSAHIGEVLVATASGLIVAIPAFIFYYILKALALNATLAAESEVNKLLEDVPFEQLQGVRIGEEVAADVSASQQMYVQEGEEQVWEEQSAEQEGWDDQEQQR